MPTFGGEHDDHHTLRSRKYSAEGNLDTGNHPEESVPFDIGKDFENHQHHTVVVHHKK